MGKTKGRIQMTEISGNSKWVWWERNNHRKEDFLLRRILMFKVLEEELGDDRGQTVGCFYPRCLTYIRKDQEGELDTACFLEGIMGKGQRDSCGSWPCCSTSLFFDKVCV